MQFCPSEIFPKASFWIRSSKSFCQMLFFTKCQTFTNAQHLNSTLKKPFAKKWSYKWKTYFDLWSCSERSWSNIKIGMLSVMLFSSKTGAKVFLKPILMCQFSKSFFQILFPRVRRRRWGHWPFWRYWRFWCFGGWSSDSDIGIVWIPENKSHVSQPHKLASFTQLQMIISRRNFQFGHPVVTINGKTWTKKKSSRKGRRIRDTYLRTSVNLFSLWWCVS